MMAEAASGVQKKFRGMAPKTVERALPLRQGQDGTCYLVNNELKDERGRSAAETPSQANDPVDASAAHVESRS